MSRIILLAACLSALFTPPVSGQQTYRCVLPNGVIAFQDKPCPQGAKQSGVTKSAPQALSAQPRVRPLATMSMSTEQREDWFALQKRYNDVFVLLGQAQACNQNMQGKQREFMAEIKRRHAQDADQILEASRFSLATGLISQKRPAPPCDSVKARLQTLKLPAIPDSIAVFDDKPQDSIVNFGYAGGRPYQVVKRAHPGGRDEYLLLHAGKIVYQSQEPLNPHRTIDGPVPALLLSVMDKTRDCPSSDGGKGRRWFVIGLPQNGAPVVNRLDHDCTVVYAYGDKSLCAWAVDRKRPSILYRVDASGVPVRNGEYAAGNCPSQ